MKLFTRLTPGLIALVGVGLSLCSCSTPRELESNYFLQASPVSEGEVYEGEDLQDGPVKPDFETLTFERKLNPILVQAPGGAYQVGPGDILDIEVAENVSTRAQTRIMPDGMLYYDVAPGINVKGKTLKEISTILAHHLKDDYVNPVVTVNVANADSQRFWLLGQIQIPGAYPLKKPTTIIDAISQGGGMLSSQVGFDSQNQDVVDLERAILIRQGELIPVDFQALIEDGDMSQNVYVRGGDYLYLPSVQKRSIFVLGSINTPGPVLYDSELTLLSAIAAAGGPRKDTIVTKVLIIRGSTRDPQVAVGRLQDIMRGRAPDIALEGGDIIWVPRSPWTNLKNYVEAILVTAAQAVAVQEGLGVLGTDGSTDITISAGGQP